MQLLGVNLVCELRCYKRILVGKPNLYSHTANSRL